MDWSLMTAPAQNKMPASASTPMSPNGRATPATSQNSNDEHLQAFWSRYEHLKLNDVMKNVLLEEVISRYEFLTRKHQEYVEQHQQELEFARTYRENNTQLQGTIGRLQNILNRDPFILVLIDGDGMIFNGQFLKSGEEGGRQAAIHLCNRVTEWAQQNVSECPADAKVVVRIYANVHGLAHTCYRAGAVDHPSKVEEFVRGFTQGKALCDFTDVGQGKDRADVKISEALKLHLYDYHCRNILFGCSHDNGYARVLEQYTSDPEAMPRLTLMEGTPFEKELDTLPFNKHKFPGLFRETKVVINPDLLTGTLPPRIDSRASGLNPASGMFTPRTATPASIYSPPPTVPNLHGHGNKAVHMRQDSITSSGTPSESDKSSWSQVASKKASQPLADLVRPATVPLDEPIKRNKYGQRLDEPLDYDRDEVQRIKKLKSCNQHYIGMGCCHYNAGKSDKCPHAHHHKFGEADLKALRVVARETPCKKGHYCDDVKCIYGHRCPFPVATEGSMRGIGCLNGALCRFPTSMHGMDTTAVRIKTVR